MKLVQANFIKNVLTSIFNEREDFIMKMKKSIRIYSVVLIVSLLLCNTSGTNIIKAENYNNDEKKTYIITTDNESDKQEISEKYDEDLLTDGQIADTLADNNILVADLSDQELVQIIAEDGTVYVEEDILLEGSGEITEEEIADDVNQWYLDAINLPENFDYSLLEDVKIGILDSGVNFTDDVSVVERINFIPGEDEVSPLFEDVLGHGTGIAGVIGAQRDGISIDGINPWSSIYSIKVLNSQNTASLSKVVAGIYWAIENDMDILNMSLGTTADSKILHQAIKDAYAAGMLLIAAGGNDIHKEVQFPAAYPEVIAVGSTDTEGKLKENTSLGTELEILAPGDQVVTNSILFGLSGVEGTSIAAAQITGAASILWGIDKSKSGDFIRQLMKQTVRLVGNAAAYDAGLIDLGYAVDTYETFSQNYTAGGPSDMDWTRNETEPEVFDDVEIVNGLWESGMHETIINSYASKNLSSAAAAILDKNRDDRVGIMCEMAKEADNTGQVYKSNTPLHGTGNYVHGLKYLYELAFNIKAASSPLTQAKIKAASDKAYATLINPNKKYVGKLKTDCEFMLWEDYSNSKYSSKNYIYINKKDKTNPTVAYFKVLGFALHSVGDVFAHRALIPEYTLTKEGAAAYSETAYFLKNDFNTDSNHLCDKTVIDKACEGDELSCKQWNCFKYAVENQKIEYRDVVRFALRGEKTRTDYEDNPALGKHLRFSDAKLSCLAFLETGLLRQGISWEIYTNPPRGTKLEKAQELANTIN